MSSAFYMGNGASALDGKGRFALPVSFRSVVTAQSHEPGTMLVRGDAGRNKCLTLFGTKVIEDFSNKADNAAAPSSAADFDQDPEGVTFWSTVRSVTIDSGGRFSLPPAFKRLFGITDGIFIVGGGRFAQLWAPERFLEAEKSNLLAIEECQMFLEELQAKRGPA